MLHMAFRIAVVPIGQVKPSAQVFGGSLVPQGDGGVSVGNAAGVLVVAGVHRWVRDLL